MKTIKPATGPGSRQPTLKLPVAMPDGKRTTLHPLLWCEQNRMLNRNKSDLARHMRVRPQSLYKWERAARADRNFPVPPLRAMQIACFFDVTPSMFRPDVYEVLP
jgi:DNA-binding XRE family transcriptional regulator